MNIKLSHILALLSIGLTIYIYRNSQKSVSPDTAENIRNTVLRDEVDNEPIFGNIRQV